jgi:hypothetical protein
MIARHLGVIVFRIHTTLFFVLAASEFVADRAGESRLAIPGRRHYQSKAKQRKRYSD